MEQDKIKQRMTNAREFVKWWFFKSGNTARTAQNKPSLFSTMLLDYYEMWGPFVHNAPSGDKRPKQINEATLVHAYNEFLSCELGAAVTLGTKELAFNGGAPEAVSAWVKAVTGATDSKDVAVISHWVWQIKRKAANLPVIYHIMPILFGPQGGGKTMALQKLIEPIKEFKLNMKMHQLSDERLYEGFSHNLVALFDELQGIERTDLNALKNQVTADTNSYRKLHTHSFVTVPMRCSFIGATNKPINESFSDSTGMRRFYQLNTAPQLNWAEINSINYLELWQSIDESKENGYLEGQALIDVAAVQKQLINDEDIHLFMTDNGLMAEPDGETKEVSSHTVYLLYQDWAARNGLRNPLSAPWFNRKLINMGLSTFEKRDAKKAKKRYYNISVDSTLFQKTDGNVTQLVRVQ